MVDIDPRLATAAKALGLIALPLGWLAGFTVFPAWFWGFVTAGFAIGLLGIPVYIYLFSYSIPLSGVVLGKMLWITGALTLGPYVLDLRDSGEYEVHPVERRADDAIVFERDGETVEIEGGLDRWARLGLRPFGIIYEKTEEQYGDLVAEIDGQTHELVRADGGDKYVLDSERGGYREWTPEEYAAGTVDGIVINAWQLVNRLRGANGTAGANRAEKEGEKEYGGDDSTSDLVYGAMVLTSLFGGAIIGWLVMGM